MEATELFEAAFKGVDGFIGLFFLKRPSTREARQLPATPEGIRTALQACQQFSSGGYDCYFSPAPLLKPTGGSRGKKEDYIGSNLLWVDLDPKERETKEDLIERVTSFSPVPSFVVDSGRGVHAYWTLDHLEHSHAAVEQRNLWLAEQLGGDHCHSIDHLLRVPGTQNWKKAQ